MYEYEYTVGSRFDLETPEQKARLRACFHRLGTEEFKPMIQFLKKLLMERTETLQSSTDMAVIYRMQGQCKAIKDILETVAKSHKS